MRSSDGARPLPLRWVQDLMKLVDEVQETVFSGKVVFEKPKMFKIAKGREKGVMQYREVASFERLSERVILSRMTAYVRDRLYAETLSAVFGIVRKMCKIPECGA